MLQRWDKGPEVARLQRALNRIGSMLLVDGDFGASTEMAVVDACRFLRRPPALAAGSELLQQLEALPEPSGALTSAGVSFIGREEVSSPAMYRAKYIRPVLPPLASGITIGIGYDLKFADRARLEADFPGLPGLVKDRLATVCGRSGTPPMLHSVRDIEVPLPVAVQAFLHRMLPEHVGHTRRIYPQLDTLAPARRTALISLVFNRGSSLDPTSDRRREMREIQQYLAEGRFEAVTAAMRSMKRLWDAASAAGVIARREREAMLWSRGFEAMGLE